MILNTEQGNALIKDFISNPKPFLASKMGDTEQNVLLCKMLSLGYDSVRESASNNAGITPSDDKTLDLFYDLYAESLRNVDLLGLWGTQKEFFIINRCKMSCQIVNGMRFLEPFYFSDPWSKSLENKRVLVIHPFESTIIKQYSKRELLFKNKDVLPDFDLLTIKAEQTNGGGRSDSKSFSQSLSIMRDKINNTSFDVAIIGCGAYGLILANDIKKMGKIAIHIGGGAQILFGIKGKRWDNHTEISALYNEYWTRPSEQEKTNNINLVEGGTYW